MVAQSGRFQRGWLWLIAVALLLPGSLRAAPPPSAMSEPFLQQFAETRRFASGRPVQPQVTPDDKTVLFLRATPTSNRQTLFAFDVATGATREVLTPEMLINGAVETLSAAEQARRERMRVTSRGFSSYQLSTDGAQILVTLSGKTYVVERASGHVTVVEGSDGALDPRFSPDGRHVAFVRDNDVYQSEPAARRSYRITNGGTAKKPHGLAEFVAQEEMGRMAGYWWSPDARWLAFAEVDNSAVEHLTIADVAHPEKTPEHMAYPRPGKANAVVRLGIVAATGGKVTWLRWDAAALPYVTQVVWPHNGPLTVVVQNRRQTELQVLTVDPASGETRSILRESDAAWLNLHPDFPLWFGDGSGFLWCTEANGGPEIVEHRADGARVRTWVKPDAGWRSLAAYNDAQHKLFFAADVDPTQSHLWSVTDAAAPVPVATGETASAVETLAHVSPSGALLVAVTQTDARLPRALVLRADAALVGELPSLVPPPPFGLRAEFLTLGPQQFHAVVLRPHQAQPGGKWPTILSVYGGPTTTVVRHSLRENLLDQWLADQGFVVVRIDGRGTPLRTAAWHRAVRGDFAAVPLDDQIAGLQALAARVPEVDLQRVGIFGWSFGGYLAALAALKRPDVFKAAVAGAPVVDWADYDTHYTERYLGLPQDHPEAYERSSLLTYAADAKRGSAALLLIHGTADDNVFFSHTLKLSNALFLAGKPHELLPLVGLTHMVPDPLVTRREYERLRDFFAVHL